MLKEVMKQRNISQAQMARMADINQTQFNRAYNGFQTFFPTWRKKISIALDIREDELFPEYIKKGEK